jgi:hypothetical protein
MRQFIQDYPGLSFVLAATLLITALIYAWAKYQVTCLKKD